jgi:AcrR family transcriptional regulator
MAVTRPHRRSSVETKARILEAAQATFAEKGYAQSLLSEIAEGADVTSPLVIRYFGSKEALFEEAFSQCLDMVPFLSAEPEEFGRNAMALLTESHMPTVRATSMLAHSIGDPHTREIAIRLLRDRVMTRLAEWLGGDAHAYARAELTIMLGVGYTTLRILTPVGQADPAGEHFVTNWMARALQMVVDLPPGERSNNRNDD